MSTQAKNKQQAGGKARKKVARRVVQIFWLTMGVPEYFSKGPWVLQPPATIMTEAEEDPQPVSFLANHYHVQGYNIQYNKRKKGKIIE